MNPFNRTRSLFKIDATAHAVGSGAFQALSPLGKLHAIAGLAGLFLRLFRRKDVLEGSPKDPRREPPGFPAGRRQPRRAGARRNSGCRLVTPGKPQPSTDRLAA